MIDLNEVDESYFDSLFAESESLVSEGLWYYRIEVEAGDIVNLITRLREAERDAARYRWLRNCTTAESKKLVSDSGGWIVGLGVLDGMIDQSMKEKGDE